MTIDGLLTNARALKQGLQGNLIREALQPLEGDIIEQQKIQLLEGKNSSGQDMHPFYSEDLKPRGYFKSRESAGRYAAWKQTINYPFTVKRNPDAPNLYITGVFHNDIGIIFGSDTLMVKPDTAYAANIMGKYGLNAFGLCAEKWGVIWNEKGGKDNLINEVKKTLWQ